MSLGDDLDFRMIIMEFGLRDGAELPLPLPLPLPALASGG
jgi:hypothetical protein